MRIFIKTEFTIHDYAVIVMPAVVLPQVVKSRINLLHFTKSDLPPYFTKLISFREKDVTL